MVSRDLVIEEAFRLLNLVRLHDILYNINVSAENVLN